MNSFDPSSITIDTPSKAFAYEALSREIDECTDTVTLKRVLCCYVKLYLKQQETVSLVINSHGIPNTKDWNV